MSAHRFFLIDELPAGAEVELPLAPEDVHHASNVLRVRAGESVEVVEPGGAAWRVRLADVGSSVITAQPLEQIADTPMRPLVTLVQGVAKGEKMDAIVRQAVEVGASEIIPVTSGRSIVRLDARKAADRAERWRRIAKSAAEQSHAPFVPDVAEPIALGEFARRLDEYDVVLVLWEESEPVGISDALEPARGRECARVAVVVGPEGGLSASEVELLAAGGARVVGLGSAILRTETAAIVGLALVLHHLGGLGAGSSS